MANKIVVIGAGIAGLSFQYFLAKNGIDCILIDMKKEIGKPIKDSGLISNKIFELIPLDKEMLVEESFRYADFIFGNSKFRIFSKKSEMNIVKRDLVDKQILELTQTLIKPKIFLNTIAISFKNNYVITNKGKFEYDLLIGADGTFSIVSKWFKMNENVSFFISEEAIVETKNENKSIELYFGKEYSKTHFLWKIYYDKRMKIGYIDKHINKNFNKRITGQLIYKYADLIKIGKTSLQKGNVLLIGEASGIVKPFSLGGITYSVITSKIASEVISKELDLKEYKILTEKFFKIPLFIGKTAKKLIKLNKIIKLFSIYKLASLFHPDFI